MFGAPLAGLLALTVPSAGLMSRAVNSLPEWFEREGYGKAGLKHESLGGGAGWAALAEGRAFCAGRPPLRDSCVIRCGGG